MMDHCAQLIIGIRSLLNARHVCLFNCCAQQGAGRSIDAAMARHYIDRTKDWLCFQEKKGANMQMVLMLGAAFLVFLIFFLAFSIKRRENDEPVRIHNCHNCNCNKKEGGHLERFRAQADAAADPGRHLHHRQIGDVREKNADPS